MINLHAHSDASIADGLFGVKKWVKALVEKGFKGHALTDHGSMVNLLPFYKAMKVAGLAPIMGVEFYYVENAQIKDKDNRKANHLILLAKDYDGYRNLCRLSDYSFKEGFYYKPRIDWESLLKYSHGLICLTACQGGILANEVWRGGEKLLSVFNKFQNLFGDDFYVEFQGHKTLNKENDNTQEFINRGLLTLPGKPIVTNDCHYILPEHARIQRILKEISWGRGETENADSATVTKEHFCDSLWLKSQEQVVESFKIDHEYFPEKILKQGLENTWEVFEKCKDFTIPKKRYMPKFSKDNNLFKTTTTDALKTFLNSNKHLNAMEYVNRFKKEYDIIVKYDLQDYFLIIWDIINFAKTNNIILGIGRGSAAGSLISYVLGIVKVNPIKYGLIFERFLNEDRCKAGELADIDLDVESENRDLIKKYLIDKYGQDNVCEIGTYVRMRMKTSILDFGKAMKVGTYAELQKITKSLVGVDSLEKAVDISPPLRDLFLKHNEFCFVVEEIDGQIKSQSIHPAGVIICSDKISEVIPLKTISGGKGNRVVVTQPEDKQLVADGMMKLDILGLKEYDIIKLILNSTNTGFNASDYVEGILAYEGTAVWDKFAIGDSDCVFQFSSDSMKSLLKTLRPRSIQELAIANALYRPGPLENGWHIEYANRKNGDKSVPKEHPIIDEILKDTYGLCVFQEQVMEIFNKLAGIGLSDSDTIRSALGKKDEEKLNKFKEQFIEGAEKHIGKDRAIYWWDSLEKFSGYSFNKSHAVSYAILAYISQYLKVKHPEHFYAANLDMEARKGKKDEFVGILKSATLEGMKFIYPDVNISSDKFYVEGDKIVFSLYSIKTIGAVCVNEILNKRPYKDFDDFYNKVNKAKVKMNSMVALIHGGALDAFGERSILLIKLYALKEKNLPKKINYYLESYKVMGFLNQSLNAMFGCKSFKKAKAGATVEFCGLLTELRKIKTKNGDDMAFATLTDEMESVSITVFPLELESYKRFLDVGEPIKVTGKKDFYNGRELIKCTTVLPLSL